jgi:putative transcriptional regulator
MSTAKLKKVEGSFSERLKMLRRERGWSQEDLAARLDVSPGSVGNWEMGPHEPHPKTLVKVAALFEVDVRFLSRGEGESQMREHTPEYRAVDLPKILREVEETRDKLDGIAQQLRMAMAKPGAAAALTEMAATSYDEKRSGGGKSRVKETPASDAQRIVAKAESGKPS